MNIILKWLIWFVFMIFVCFIIRHLYIKYIKTGKRTIENEEENNFQFSIFNFQLNKEGGVQ
jgi:hypothetical protein